VGRPALHRPNNWWAAGDTRETVRDILQRSCSGSPATTAPASFPRRHFRTAPGFIPDAVQAIWVQHVSGGVSVVQFKSYDQGREAFQGTEQDGIWLDEEPPEDVYTECLLRTMTNDGMVMLTFTPLRGLSASCTAFMPGGAVPEQAEGSKAVVSATWDDVPHLTQQAKDDLWRAIPPFQRDARSKGLPQLGAGLIYPMPEAPSSRALRDPEALATKLWPGRRLEPHRGHLGRGRQRDGHGILVLGALPRRSRARGARVSHPGPRAHAGRH
jgi:phage terminase large subunit-like protein